MNDSSRQAKAQSATQWDGFVTGTGTETSGVSDCQQSALFMPPRQQGLISDFGSSRSCSKVST
jgi:hypothetical protein